MTYIPADTGDGVRALVWVDRAGGEEPLQGEALAYGGVQISPDGMRVALVVEGSESLEDLWLHDVAGETTAPLTFNPTADMQPLWTPDGQHVVFLSDQEGVNTVLRRRADGTDQAESIAAISSGFAPMLSSVSPDGETLVYAELRPETGWDLMQLSLAGEPSPQALLASGSGERYGQISPDGRWLAYSSDELGQP